MFTNWCLPGLYVVIHSLRKDWLTDMANAALVNPTPEDYRLAGARIRTLADQPITLSDAVAAVIATRLKIEVWTYDHHFDVMCVPVWR